jgi:hypothetical protein
LPQCSPFLVFCGAAVASATGIITIPPGQAAKVGASTIRCTALLPGPAMHYSGNGTLALAPFTLETGRVLHWTDVQADTPNLHGP